MGALAPLKRLGRGFAYWAAGDFLPVAFGGTGATTTAGALANLGLNGAAQDSFRNRLRNGACAINQRAVSGTVTLAAGAYGHDGWRAGANGCTYTFAASGIDSVISISAGTLVQPVEAAKIEGGPYTLSWANTAQGRATYTAAGASSTTTTAWGASPLTVPATQPGTQVNVELGAGSGSGTVTFTRAQLEPGISATVFERREPAYEALLCGFYYRVMVVGATVWAGDYNAYAVPFDFPTMRVAPSAAAPTVNSQTNNTGGYPQVTIRSATSASLLLAANNPPSVLAAAVTVALSAELTS